MPRAAVKDFQRLLEGLGDRGRESPQQRRAFAREPAQVLTAVLRTPLPADECLGFQAIHQPGDPGRFLDEPRRNLERGQAVLSRSFQDLQDVILLQRHAVRFHDARHGPAHEVCSSKQSHGGLVRRRIFGLLPLPALPVHDTNIPCQ